MSLAVAIIPSNQDIWHPPHTWPEQFWTYSEAGGAEQISTRMMAEFAKVGVLATYWRAIPESQDAHHIGLTKTMQEAAAWLRVQALGGAKVCALHIHTNAGATPLAGTSHTGYCYGDTESEMLGATIAAHMGDVLNLPVVAYNYTGLSYLFDRLFAPIPSALLEVTRHDRLLDLTALYGRVDAVATAVVDGTLAWSGECHTAQIAALEAEVARLRDQIARARAVLGEA